MVSDPNDSTIIDLDAEQVVEQPEKVSAQQPVQKRNRGWLLAVAALVAGSIGGGWLYRDVLSAYFPSDQTLQMSDRLALLETTNAGLRTSLAGLEKLSAQLTADVDALEGKDSTLARSVEEQQKLQSLSGDRLTGVEERLAATTTALDALANRAPATTGNTANGSLPVADVAALRARIETLEKDVASLKVKPDEAADNKAALSQALADLKAKVSSGTGFRSELERLQRMVPAASGLDVLQPHAGLGLPDAKGLAAELKALVPSLPKPIVPGPVPESEGWWASIYNSLSDLIIIRIEGDTDWPTAALASAAFADAGDVKQAVEHLGAVEGARPLGIQQWLDRAQARLNVDVALGSIEEAVLRVMAAKG